MAQTYGEIAYNAYGDERSWKTFSGDPMPNWEHQDPALQRAWEMAAVAIIRELTVK